MWIGTRAGLTVYNPLQGRFYHCRYKQPDGTVAAIGGGARGIIPKGRKIFVGTGRGLLLFTGPGRVGDVVKVKGGASTYSVSSIAYDSARNELWALADDNLYKYDEHSNELVFVAEAVKRLTALRWVVAISSGWVPKMGFIVSVKAIVHFLPTGLPSLCG
ncbi:hypothetical protein MKQ70_06690 [Chitinophaga sedimenti]|nr:hypothetical protein [Chitinophaga sedimenti]